MVKWAKIAFYQLQEKEIQECSDILALVPYHPKMVNMYGYIIFEAKFRVFLPHMPCFIPTTQIVVRLFLPLMASLPWNCTLFMRINHLHITLSILCICLLTNILSTDNERKASYIHISAFKIRKGCSTTITASRGTSS